MNALITSLNRPIKPRRKYPFALVPYGALLSTQCNHTGERPPKTLCISKHKIDYSKEPPWYGRQGTGLANVCSYFKRHNPCRNGRFPCSIRLVRALPAIVMFKFYALITCYVLNKIIYLLKGDISRNNSYFMPVGSHINP